jgi:hypothetical protein
MKFLKKLHLFCIVLPIIAIFFICIFIITFFQYIIDISIVPKSNT